MAAHSNFTAPSYIAFPFPLLFGIWALGICAVLIWYTRYRYRTEASNAPGGNAPDYLRQFPPSRRHVLGLIPHFNHKGIIQASKDGGISPGLLQAKAIPTTREVCETDLDCLTPTGFSLRDIKTIGRFPDYALLSGVPKPKPCSPDFDISRATFRPFRPFRWGYHQTMAVMKLEPNYWLELEQNYSASLSARAELLTKHADRTFFHSPDSELACRELLEMVLQFLTERYPSYFRLTSSNTVLENKLLNTSTKLTGPDSPHPLAILTATVPEDFALMLRDPATGKYHLRAAAVCSSVGWDIAHNRGKSLAAIHTPVPDIDKMSLSMDRYFARMPTDAPVQRCSWSLEDCAPLFSSPFASAASTAAAATPEEAPQTQWRRSAFTDAEIAAGACSAADVRLRCDWQTLRRLPLSGAIAFNYKPVFTPLAELRREPYVPALLARVLREGKGNLIDYKALPHVRGLSLTALDGWAEEQVRGGVVPEGWEPKTLDEHPFFPGWEGRWHAKQGF